MVSVSTTTTKIRWNYKAITTGKIITQIDAKNPWIETYPTWGDGLINLIAEHCHEAVDVLLVEEIERKDQAMWIHDRCGRVLWVGNKVRDIPTWWIAARDFITPAPHEYRDEWEAQCLEVAYYLQGMTYHAAGQPLPARV